MSQPGGYIRAYEVGSYLESLGRDAAAPLSVSIKADDIRMIEQYPSILNIAQLLTRDGVRFVFPGTHEEAVEAILSALKEVLA